MTTRHYRENCNLQIYSDPSVVNGYSNWDSISSAENAALRLTIKDNDYVLDIGCGTGRIANFFSQTNIKYHGIDLSEAMIRMAKKRFPELDFTVFDAFNLNPKMKKPDCVLFMHNGLDLLYPYKRRISMLKQIINILKPKGGLIFSSHVPDWEWRSIKTTIGFRPKIYRLLKNITRSQCGFIPEDYRGKILWNYRASTNEIKKELNAVGFELRAVFPDNSRHPPDWNYYVAHLKI